MNILRYKNGGHVAYFIIYQKLFMCQLYVDLICSSLNYFAFSVNVHTFVDDAVIFGLSFVKKLWLFLKVFVRIFTNKKHSVDLTLIHVPGTSTFSLIIALNLSRFYLVLREILWRN